MSDEQIVEIVRDAAGEPADASIFCAWRSCSSSRLRSSEILDDDDEVDGTPLPVPMHAHREVHG